jgi:DNA (cytosine-5)-methyltransferase 1
MNYYNDNDPKACAWLRELIAAGEIAPGHVDERSILEIKPDDLAKFDQCHFFAGIGGWALALRWAGLGDAAGIWTGSCPCQPLSCAGQRKGHADERHLWPAFHALIAKRRPATVFGEQVAGADGREWFAAVRSDMEDLGYACGGADLCAAGVGSPTMRQRLFWVAYATGARRCRGTCMEAQPRETAGGPSQVVRAVAWPDGYGSGSALSVGDVLQASHGIPGRMGLLRGYGNAIVPEVAEVFVRAWMDCRANH